MKIPLILAAVGAITLQTASSINPSKIFGPKTQNSDVEVQLKESIVVLADAKALSDFESVVANMPATSKLDPATITAMIESHRRSAKEKIDSKSLEKMLKESQQALLDANKAIKRADSLQDEVDRLRNKIESMRKQGKR